MYEDKRYAKFLSGAFDTVEKLGSGVDDNGE
jgi:hypothetical protein